jgi:hypothetical protein
MNYLMITLDQRSQWALSRNYEPKKKRGEKPATEDERNIRKNIL